MSEPKVIEKNGKFTVQMPNGFIAGPYDSEDKCASFLGITKNMMDIVHKVTGRRIIQPDYRGSGGLNESIL